MVLVGVVVVLSLAVSVVCVPLSLHGQFTLTLHMIHTKCNTHTSSLLLCTPLLSWCMVVVVVVVVVVLSLSLLCCLSLSHTLTH